jgi:hypothetical protein
MQQWHLQRSQVASSGAALPITGRSVKQSTQQVEKDQAPVANLTQPSQGF